MKVGVISDTHIPDKAFELPKELLEELSKFDFIIHAGDFTQMSVLKSLEKLNRVIAVWGNMDASEIRSKLPQKQIINVEHFKVGIFHGWGDPHSLPQRVLKQFEPDRVSCIVFGHSHQAYNKLINNVLMFNPGSPTDKVFAHFNSYGVLEITNKVEGKIIKI